MKIIPIIKAESLIPKDSYYCYQRTEQDKENPMKLHVIGRCPFHSIINFEEEQNNGYCAYMKKGDWDLNFGLLWDSVKECGIRYPDNEEIRL